jgi:ArsR family transcriptional regulator
MKDVVKTFKALADPTRLRIVRLLRLRELCVCELMFVLEMEQSRVSHHMRVLREAGLAEDVRAGRWIVYRLPAATRSLVEGLLSGALDERLETSPEASADALKLAECLRQNIRGRVCDAAPREARS